MPRSSSSNSSNSSASGSSVGVASEILAYCTSCKMDLNHVVVAMKGDRVAKVQCLTCKKEHTYKTPKGITEPPAATAKKKKPAKAGSDGPLESTSVTAEWEKLMNLHRDAPKKVYHTKSSFGLGDKLDHPTFGEGIVGKLIYPNKLEVIFKTDIKILIHGGVHI